MTIVMVTHDPDVARRCKRIVHIRDGKIYKDERVYPAFGAARAESDRRAGTSNEAGRQGGGAIMNADYPLAYGEQHGKRADRRR